MKVDKPDCSNKPFLQVDSRVARVNLQNEDKPSSYPQLFFSAAFGEAEPVTP